MPSTMPPLDAAGEWARQGESAARIALESDPLRQSLPQVEPTRSRPLLPGYPASEPAQESAGTPAAAPSEFDIHPQIEPERWVTPDDTWNTSSFKALNGGRMVARSTRPLPRPQRFRRVPRWRSYLYLVVLLLVIAIVSLGAVEITSLTKEVFGQPPRSTQPAPTHTATPLHTTPTAKPRK
ncbi:MAG TPA: hypothetical protein VE258_06935 [Ktedonobacterales bacterium]|nr:hypothetical protein [Ktedonobacterales bacterium]